MVILTQVSDVTNRFREYLRCQCHHLSIFGATFLVAPNTVEPFEDVHLFLRIHTSPLIPIVLGICFLIYLLLMPLAQVPLRDHGCHGLPSRFRNDVTRGHSYPRIAWSQRCPFVGEQIEDDAADGSHGHILVDHQTKPWKSVSSSRFPRFLWTESILVIDCFPLLLLFTVECRHVAK